ncbi:SH2D6 isoform 5 [Pongo abelii]|uniref:SH2D6 isoform 5 n=1 Tax=Pongo abelii TaxID=9601 RepID=A0A2J8TED3_PONAB|nr:SH2D6 isoform 5 [Pongo abelii]
MQNGLPGPQSHWKSRDRRSHEESLKGFRQSRDTTRATMSKGSGTGQGRTGLRAMARSRLTATSASRVQAILLPQPPEGWDYRSSEPPPSSSLQ